MRYVTKRSFEAHPNNRNGAALYGVGRKTQKTVEAIVSAMAAEDNTIQDTDKELDSVQVRNLEVPKIQGNYETLNSRGTSGNGSCFNKTKGTYSAKSGELNFTTLWEGRTPDSMHHDDDYYTFYDSRRVSASRSEDSEKVSYQLDVREVHWDTDESVGGESTRVVVDKSSGEMTVESTRKINSLPTDLTPASRGETWNFSPTGPIGPGQIEPWKKANRNRSRIDIDMKSIARLDNSSSDLNPVVGEVVLAELGQDGEIYESSAQIDVESAKVTAYSSTSIGKSGYSFHQASFQLAPDGTQTYITGAREQLVVKPDGSSKLTKFGELISPSEIAREAEAARLAEKAEVEPNTKTKTKKPWYAGIFS